MRLRASSCATPGTSRRQARTPLWPLSHFGLLSTSEPPSVVVDGGRSHRGKVALRTWNGKGHRPMQKCRRQRRRSEVQATAPESERKRPEPSVRERKTSRRFPGEKRKPGGQIPQVSKENCLSDFLQDSLQN